MYDSIAIGSVFSNLQTVQTNSGDKYRYGEYISSTGIVLIYAEEKYIEFRLVHDGRLYTRKVYVDLPTQRSIAIMAGKFQRKIINNSNNNISGKIWQKEVVHKAPY